MLSLPVVTISAFRRSESIRIQSPRNPPHAEPTPQLLRAGEPQLRPRRRVHQAPAGAAGHHQSLQQRLSLHPPPGEGRRLDRGDRRLAGRAQPPQAAHQGRHPLQPRGERGRGDGLGRPHDLQVRRGGRPLRRRQGRHQDRQPEVQQERAGADHPPLHLRAGEEELHRPRHRRAGPGLRHRRPGDGLDRGHLHGPLPRQAGGRRLRHRQAAGPGGHPRPHRGHRPRRGLCDARRLQRRRGHAEARPLAGDRRQAGDRPGARQRRLLHRRIPPADGGDHHRPDRVRRRALRSPGAGCRGHHQAVERPAPRREVDQEAGPPRARPAAGERPGGAGARLRRPHPGGAGKPDHRRERAADQGQDHRRRGQRTDHQRRRARCSTSGAC